MKLSDDRCAPVQKGQGPLAAGEAEALARQVPGWSLSGNAIEREYSFAGFGEAMEFVNEVAAAAAGQDHHPDICVYYNRVALRLTTHKAGGLTRNDFILAAKIGEISPQGK